MATMPRPSGKLKDLAYKILGKPIALDEDLKKTSKSNSGMGKLNISVFPLDIKQ